MTITSHLEISDLSLKYREELEYIYDSLDYLREHIINKLEEHNERYRKLEEEFDPFDIIICGDSERTEEENKEFSDECVEKMKKTEYNKLKSISSTILESILVRQVSIMEKYLVELSFLVFDILTEKKQVILPPNIDHEYYNDKRKKFTDCLKAGKFIENNTKIGITKKQQWKLFVKLRDLRHKLAHGENGIELGDEEVKEYNKIFDKAIFEKDADNLYQLKPNYTLMLKINEYLEEFIIFIDSEIQKSLIDVKNM